VVHPRLFAETSSFLPSVTFYPPLLFLVVPIEASTISVAMKSGQLEVATFPDHLPLSVPALAACRVARVG